MAPIIHCFLPKFRHLSLQSAPKKPPHVTTTPYNCITPTLSPHRPPSQSPPGAQSSPSFSPSPLLTHVVFCFGAFAHVVPSTWTAFPRFNMDKGIYAWARWKMSCRGRKSNFAGGEQRTVPLGREEGNASVDLERRIRCLTSSRLLPWEPTHAL